MEEALRRLAGGPGKDEAEEEVALDAEPPPAVVTLYMSDEEEEEEEESVNSDCFGEESVAARPRGSGWLSSCSVLALCLKSSVSMSWFRRSMGEPLDSEYSTPKCRRWARAWLDKPLRVSNQAPHS